MMSDSQVSVGAALSYAWSLWRSHWREIWGVLALNALGCTVLCAGVFAQSTVQPRALSASTPQISRQWLRHRDQA